MRQTIANGILGQLCWPEAKLLADGCVESQIHNIYGPHPRETHDADRRRLTA